MHAASLVLATGIKKKQSSGSVIPLPQEVLAELNFLFRFLLCDMKSFLLLVALTLLQTSVHRSFFSSLRLNAYGLIFIAADIKLENLWGMF